MEEKSTEVSLQMRPLRRVRRSRIQYERLQRPPGIAVGEPTPSIEGWTLFFTNLHPDTTEMKIKDLMCSFEDPEYFGVIVDIRVLLDAKGRCLGCALVEVDTEEGFRRALKELNGKELLSRPVKVGPTFLAEEDEPEGEGEEEDGELGEKRGRQQEEDETPTEKRIHGENGDAAEE